MNNAQFRKLLETPRPAASSSSNAPSATPALGSRQRSSIPMTPRALTTGNNEFARQLAAHRASQLPQKKFRSSAAPKGTKLSSGYVDRAAARSTEDTIEDERLQRLEALQQLAKDGQIEHEEYVRQTKLLGGDVSSTHLVKGLDFALLERVRAGENVMEAKKPEPEEEPEELPEEWIEAQLESALESTVAPISRPKEKKHGTLAPNAKPKTRAEILAELKASRQAAKAPVLSDKFKKIGSAPPPPAEPGVKIVVGADGKVKRKVKRSEKERREKEEVAAREAEEETKAPRVMGMMPPPPLRGTKPVAPADEESDDDIFADAGDYNPLAGLVDDSDSDSEEPPKRPKPDTATPEMEKSVSPSIAAPLATASMPPPPTPSTAPSIPPPSTPSRYFTTPSLEEDTIYVPPTSATDLLKSHPTLAAALQKASKLAPPVEDAQEKKRKALIAAHERDSYDIDMGFGGSTDFGDDDDEAPMEKGKKRKRGGGPKKKGDRNSAEVVGKIVEAKYGGK